MKSTCGGSWSVQLTIVLVYLMITRWANNRKFLFDDGMDQSENMSMRVYDSITTDVISNFAQSTILASTIPSLTSSNNHVTLPSDWLIESALNTLKKNSSVHDTEKANSISSYITAVTHSKTSSNFTNRLTIGQIDETLGNLTGANYLINTEEVLLIMMQPNSTCENVTVIGGSFHRDTGARIINNSNKDKVTNSSLTAAGFVTVSALVNVTSFNILIIKNPTAYLDVDTSVHRRLVSSIIIATINKESYDPNNLVIDLYFQVIIPPNPNDNATYLCVFYDTKTAQWNDSGCTKPIFNNRLARYECQCYHLTSFALLWSLKPTQPSTNDTRVVLDAQDKASIVFQFLSIACFLGIIIDGITVRIISPQKYTQSRHLLPLISCVITMIFFVFYTALSLTVYTKTILSNQTECFLSSSVLMFFVYFFLILMFCGKTCVGYFNYIHFIQLFPEPSFRRSFVLLSLSFIISLIWMAFAIGFNSSPAFHISHLDSFKLCWFARDATYYFLIIPTSLFVLINVILFILVTRRILQHVRNATTSDQSHMRMKQCVLVLFSLYLTQGIAWLFGPLIIIPNSISKMVLGWLFIIFIGLEGLWSAIVHIIIRINHMDESLRIKATRKCRVPNNAIRRGHGVSVIGH